MESGRIQPGVTDGLAIARASVCACGWETPYARAGSGSAVLLLGDLADAVVAELFRALTADHRVIVPERPVRSTGEGPVPGCGCEEPAPSAGAHDWLSGLLDGLGLMEVALVVGDASLVGAAAALAANDPGRVRRLVLLERAPDAVPADVAFAVEAAGCACLLRRLPAGDPGRSHHALEALTRDIQAFLSAASPAERAGARPSPIVSARGLVLDR